MTDTVDKVIIESELQGGDQTAAGLKKVEDGLTGITVAADTTEKSTTSIDSRFSSLERRFQTTAGQAAQYEKIQAQVNLAVAQNPALQDRANAVLEAAAAKYTASGIAAKGASAELGHIDEIGAVLESRMAGLGNSMGLIGQVLQVIGPLGLAAGVGLGAVAVALNYVSEQANKFGESSIHLRNVADAAGLTTTEVRGLSEAAEKAGISGDAIAGSFERFTGNLDAARTGTGTLFESIAKINPALAVELASTRDGATAWDILAKAIAGTTDATTRAALAKASFGREGVTAVPVLITTDQAGGIKAYSDELQKATGITDELTQHTAALKAEIESTKKQTADVYASIYSDDVLARQAKFAAVELQIAQSVKDFALGKSNLAPESVLAQVGNNFGGELAGTFGPQNTPAAETRAPTSAPSRAGNTEPLKAEDAATKELAQSTSLLAAAQNKAQAAQQALASAEQSGAASASELSNARKSAGDALELLSNVEKQHITALSGAASGDEILKQKTDALSAAFMQGKVSAEDYNRALHGDTNNQVAALQDQRAVIEAVGGAEKMAAQEAANYNAMLRAGKDPADALVIAAQQLANAEAQASAAAREQLFTLQNNLGVSQASTAAGQMKAQQEATYNQLLHQNVDEETASAVAAAQYADSKAKAVAAAQKQVEASNDQLDILKSQGTENEALVKASIDYKNAIEAGATAMQAGALWANSIETSMINAAKAADQEADAQTKATEQMMKAAQQGSSLGQGQFAPQMMPKGDLSIDAGINSSIVYKNQGPGQRLDLGQGTITAQVLKQVAAQTTPDSTAAKFVAKGDYAGAINAVEKMPGQTPDNSAQISVVDNLTKVLNGQTSDKNVQASNLQQEIGWLNTQPETIARDQKIIDLQQSIDSLKTATVSNTAALTNLNTPGNTTAYADPLLHTELMSGGDTSYAQYFYQNPTMPAPIQMKDPGPAANTNTPQAAPSVIIQVQPGVQADQFIVARAQIQRAVAGALGG